MSNIEQDTEFKCESYYLKNHLWITKYIHELINIRLILIILHTIYMVSHMFLNNNIFEHLKNYVLFKYQYKKEYIHIMSLYAIYIIKIK